MADTHTPVLKIDWQAVAEAMGQGVVTSIRGLAEAADDDLQAFGLGIGNDLVASLQEPDQAKREAIKAELFGQARALAELNRIRLNAAAWDQVNTVLSVAMNIGTKLLGGLAAGAIAAI